MTVIPVNLGPFFHARATFRPDKQGLDLRGQRSVSIDEVDIFTGLITLSLTNQDESTAFTLEDVVNVVLELHPDEAAGASVVTQKGEYSYTVAGNRVVRDAVRVIIMNLPVGASEIEFKAHIVALAEALARRFDQEPVLLELQKNGVSAHVYGVTR